MQVHDNKITMTDKEWTDFQEGNKAPWRPRTIEEFNAMCELGAAMHLAENTLSMGAGMAIASRRMKFGPNGEINYPADMAIIDYFNLYGEAPSPEELAAYKRGERKPDRPGMNLFKLSTKNDVDLDSDASDE
jgi:hypothetical protein